MVDTKFESLYELVKEDGFLYNQNGTVIRVYRDRSNKTRKVAVKIVSAYEDNDKKIIENEISIL